MFFFFQAEDGIRDLTVTWSSDVCSSDLPRARALAVDREDAVERALGPDERHAEVRSAPGCEHRVGGGEPGIFLRALQRERRARLDDVARETGRRGRARPERRLGGLTLGRGHDELVLLEDPDR